VYCHDVERPLAELDAVRAEVELAGIEKPSLVLATKADEAPAPAGMLGVSVLDEESLERLRGAIWELTGLVRVFVRKPGDAEAEAIALHPPATVREVARAIHHDLERRCLGAHAWGPSARFDGQRVGRDHEVADGDTLEILG
jgi:ribosome-interacting GTPase 1